MGFIKSFITFFTYRAEIEKVIKDRQAAKEAHEKLLRMTHLRLCAKHQQESKRSYYAEHNCDYCNALAGKIRTVDKL